MDLQEQIKAYTAWINSQLKKRSQRIDDLGLDLQDGCALVTVVEIVSGQDLHGIKPTNDKEKVENVLKVLNFMKNNGIKLNHVSAEEIVSGNVKTLMQLILALAAHFKPASIGGRKHTMERHHQSTTVKHRWKNRANDNSSASSVMSEEQLKLYDNMETEITTVRNLAENLQKLILEELEVQPIEVENPFEESIILQAKLDQSITENLHLQDDQQKLQALNRSLSSEKVVADRRLEQLEKDLLTLRQDLLHSNFDRDKLLSEKAELSVELEEAVNERDRYWSQLHKRETTISQLEDEITFLKAKHSIITTRKDKELAQLQTQIKNLSNHADTNINEQSILSRLPNSPVLPRSPNSPSYLRPSGSPKLSRRSPVSRSHPPRRNKFAQKSMENIQTRILYFSERDMTPAITTISKRVGDITLGDFKAAIKKDGNFRYVFKALDPELGTVKEEVFRNDDIIPGWEGKIVAWVEEEQRV